MRTQLLVLAALLLVPASASAVGGCTGPACYDVGGYGDDCDGSYFEQVRAGAVLGVHVARWCGAEADGLRVEGSAVVASATFLWYTEGDACRGWIYTTSPVQRYDEDVSCPADPPAFPPLLAVLP